MQSIVNWPYKLRAGHSVNPADGAYAMDAVNWLVHGKHGDALECACPVISAYVILGKDDMPDDVRQRFLPYLHRIAGSRSAKHEAARARILWLAAIRVFAPRALESAGLSNEAARLRALPNNTTAKTAWVASEAAAAAAAAAPEAAWVASMAAMAAAAAAKAASEAAKAASEAASEEAAKWAASMAAKAAAKAAAAAAKAAWVASMAAMAAAAAKAAAKAASEAAAAAAKAASEAAKAASEAASEAAAVWVASEAAAAKAAMAAAAAAAEAASVAAAWDDYFSVLDAALNAGPQGEPWSADAIRAGVREFEAAIS